MKLSYMAKLAVVVGAIVGIGTLVGLVTGNLLVFGHVKLVGSNIKNGQVLAAAEVPAQVWLKFSEHLNEKRSTVYVIKVEGAVVADQGDPSVSKDGENGILTVTIKDLKPGIYQIRWIAVAEEDAGFTEGVVTFSVRE